MIWTVHTWPLRGVPKIGIANRWSENFAVGSSVLQVGFSKREMSIFAFAPTAVYRGLPWDICHTIIYRTKMTLFATCSTRPSARPSTFSPCPPSAPATVLCARADCPWPLRPYARLRDCVHPPLHLLAVLATRTRTVSLAVPAGCFVCSTRPSARSSTFSLYPPSAPATVLYARATHPRPLRPHARLRNCVRPPLHLLAVPVTRTCTVLLAVSAILSTCPLARPSTSSQCLSPALAPFS